MLLVHLSSFRLTDTVKMSNEISTETNATLDSSRVTPKSVFSPIRITNLFLCVFFCLVPLASNVNFPSADKKA
jgi:hypothetical protein